MRIGGGIISGEGKRSMGYSKYFHSNTLFCSHPEGIAQTVACDADLYGIPTPAEYFENIFASCSTHEECREKVNSLMSRVRGGYAVAVMRDGHLFLFRDPAGKKSLFYDGKGCASEGKALSLPPVPVCPGELLCIPHGSLFRHVFNTIPTCNPETLGTALEESMSACAEKDAALLFSGGIDSALLAALSDIPVITCGIEGSPDMRFARQAADLLQKDHISISIHPQDIAQALPEVMNILENKTLMHIEIGLLMYFVCREWDGSILISGQGADELFGGYYKYEKAFSQKTPIREMMKADFHSMACGLERDGFIAERFHKKIRYPYLDIPVIEQAQGIPTSLLFEPQRKAFLRSVAEWFSIPHEIVVKPKKALQYGSGFHKIVRKML